MGGELADDFVGLAEGDPFEDEPVGEVGGEEERIGGGGADAWGVDLHAGDHFGEDLEGYFDGVDGVEERFLVFLHVPVVGHGETFEECEDREEIAVETTGFAAGEFGDVRVFLLRHETGAGGVGVAEGDEAEFCGDPEDDVLAEAREVGAGEGEGEEDFGDVVAVGDGVHAIAGDPVEAEAFGDALAVEGDGGTGEGAGA